MSAAAQSPVGAVGGIRSPGSLGIVRYCARLAAALAELGIEYRALPRRQPGTPAHLHVGNSSRHPVLDAARISTFVTTLHDVQPRTRALEPLYRAIVYPIAVRRAAVTVVHSAHAADLLRRVAGPAGSVEVIPHPATPLAHVARDAARRALGIADGTLVAVLPGVVKRAKLVREAVAGTALARRTAPWQLVLAGPVRDRAVANEARALGATVLDRPHDEEYERALAAADVVLVLRDRSVGETNGPLLDAIGAHRAVLATRTGSIPEVAGAAAHYAEPTAAGVAAGLRELADSAARTEYEHAAALRAATLTWSASARAHAAIFGKVFDA